METTHEMLRMVRKEFSQSKTIMRGWHQLELRIFGRTGKDLRGTLLRSSKSENDKEKHHQIVEILREKIRKVEPTMKRI